MDSPEEGECSNSVDVYTAGPIRKRRFSSARIQPTRIKKVMQSDEDIGRMVASVPVAIGSAMEHFAEKILEAAARCVPFSTSRTLSPMHLRFAVMQNPHFAFLEPLMKEIKLPKLTETAELSGIVLSSRDRFHQNFLRDMRPIKVPHRKGVRVTHDITPTELQMLYQPQRVVYEENK